MKTVVIIGGGFSGSLTAIQILSKSRDISVKIVNDGHPTAKGLAYDTYLPEYLLNVPALKMSAFENEPTHFINWLNSKEEYTQYSGNEFLPRFIYGAYLNSLFDQFSASKLLEIINAKAIDIKQSAASYTVILNNGSSLTADKIVLAMGNYLPAAPKMIDPDFLKSTSYFKNPWNQSCLQGIDLSKNILLIGTGLTMADCLLDLIKIKFKGKIYVSSPRGYTPASHEHYVFYPDFYPELKGLSLAEIFKAVRNHLKTAALKNISWDAVIDSIRPHASEIWMSFSQKEKQQFISHIRHIWGVARHRLPKELHKEMMDLKKAGQLEIIGGRIESLKEKDKQITALILLRKERSLKELCVSRVVNCTGPQINYSELNDELIQNLLSSGIILADELKMGLKAGLSGEIISQGNIVSGDIYAIGSLLRGVLWETTAVPDIRIQAETIAKQIIES